MLEPFRQIGQWTSQKAQSIPLAIGQPKSDDGQTWQMSSTSLPSLSMVSGMPTPVLPVLTQDTLGNPQAKQAGLTPTQGHALWQLGKERVERLAGRLSQMPWAQNVPDMLPWKKTHASMPENPFVSTPGKIGASSQNQQTKLSLRERIARKLRRSKPPKAEPKPSSGYRSRQAVMKDFPFPYNDLSKLPRFTLRPEEIAINPQAEKLGALERQLVAISEESDNIFMPADYLIL